MSDQEYIKKIEEENKLLQQEMELHYQIFARMAKSLTTMTFYLREAWQINVKREMTSYKQADYDNADKLADERFFDRVNMMSEKYNHRGNTLEQTLQNIDGKTFEIAMEITEQVAKGTLDLKLSPKNSDINFHGFPPGFP